MKKISQDIYALSGGAVVRFTGSSKNAPTHSAPKLLPTNADTEEWCNWGDDNLYPKRLLEKIEKVGAASGGLEILTSAHYGTGIKVYEMRDGETDATFHEVIPSEAPNIFDFFDRTQFELVLSDVIVDYETLGIAFPEFLLSPNGNEIISVIRHKAADCRFEKPINGMINHVYINTAWGETEFDKRNTVKVPCFSMYHSMQEIQEECKKRGIRKFIMPIINTLTIEKVYPSVGWHSAFKSGWIDVVLSIPEFKKYMYEQQFNFKYLIHIADDYFVHRYGKEVWDEFDAEKKERLRNEMATAIDEEMSGNKGGGKSLISPFFRDRNSGEVIKGIQIEEIPQTLASGEFLPDASAGNSEILFSMGVDPALLGAGIPGGKNLSGSGSDKREAYTILCARLPRKHARTLQVFRLIQKWNGWNPNFVAKLPNINLTTLDKNPNGQVKVIN
ncbi:hypothetical protein AB4865_07460 [Capnocytophaga sp. ARDL2]|uniref:hypothetical protein n=1 Tax=Capnocytophaga sp. ARDL2 TaxID=3238809 RepID=UPI003557D94A